MTIKVVFMALRDEFLGPCTQVHGQGVPPPSGRGRGGGDAGSLLPGVLPPELVACLCDGIARDNRHYIMSAPSAPQAAPECNPETTAEPPPRVPP